MIVPFVRTHLILDRDLLDAIDRVAPEMTRPGEPPVGRSAAAREILRRGLAVIEREETEPPAPRAYSDVPIATEPRLAERGFAGRASFGDPVHFGPAEPAAPEAPPQATTKVVRFASPSAPAPITGVDQVE